MGKTIERMRANPRADWQIADVEKACREAGLACMKPAGGSHCKIGNPGGGRRFTIAARRPIKAHATISDGDPVPAPRASSMAAE